MLVGTSEPYNYEEVRDQIRTWLDPGKITMLDNNCEFVKIDRIYRSIIFKSTGKKQECKFSIIPNKTIVNPTFTIEDWKGSNKVQLLLNGNRMEVRSAREGNSLLVWVRSTIDKETTITIL